MWCCAGRGGTSLLGSISGCANASVCSTNIAESCVNDEDPGPICHLQCTIHKVVIYNGETPKHTAEFSWGWLLGQVRLLHVDLFPLGAEYKQKRTSTGRRLSHQDTAEDDFWVWGDEVPHVGSYCREGDSDLPHEGSSKGQVAEPSGITPANTEIFDCDKSAVGSNAHYSGEALPVLDIHTSSKMILRVREGVADWRRKDEQLEVVGESRFSVDEHLLPVVDAVGLQSTLTLPIRRGSRNCGFMFITLRVSCGYKEELHAFLARKRRFAARHCLPDCKERELENGSPTGVLSDIAALNLHKSFLRYSPARKHALSRNMWGTWEPSFESHTGSDQMAEEMVADELAEERDPFVFSLQPLHKFSEDVTATAITTRDQQSQLPQMPHAVQLQESCVGARMAVSPPSPPVRISAHPGKISCCAIFPTGDQVVTGSCDSTAVIWSAMDGERLRTFCTHKARIEACTVFQCGSMVLTISEDGIGYVWLPTTGDIVTTFDGARRFCQVFPSGERVVCALECEAGAAAIFDLDGGKMSLDGHKAPVLGAAIFPSGDKVFTVSADADACLWLENGGFLRVLTGHSSAVTCCAVAPSGDWVVTGSDDATGIIWAASGEGNDFGRKKTVFEGHSLAIRDCGVVLSSQAAVTVGDDSHAFIWSTDGRCLLQLVGHANSIGTCAIFPSSTEVITTTIDGTESAVWSCVDGHQLAFFRRNFIVVDKSPRDPTMKAEASGDVANGCRGDSKGPSSHVGTCSVFPEGDRAMTVWDDGTATIWPNAVLFGFAISSIFENGRSSKSSRSTRLQM